MLRQFLIVCLMLFTHSTHAKPSPELQSLKEKLSPIHAMEADFKQEVRQAGGEVSQTVSGHLQIKKPGLFRWEVLEPEKNLIVSDGKKVWNYDEDLEQVTVQYLERASGTPVFFLSGEVDSLDKDFMVKDVTKLPDNCSSKSSLCYLLHPHQADSPFQWIKIGFHEDRLHELQILDQLGQVSRFYFSKIKTNTALEKTIFQFTPPKGVDVIGP